MENVDSYFEVFEKKGKKVKKGFAIDYFSGIFQPNAQVVGNKNEKS